MAVEGGGGFCPWPPPLIDGPIDPVHFVPVAAQFCGQRSIRMPLANMGRYIVYVGPGLGGGGNGWGNF
jgi:hypothetical protein